ncbi:aldehyde dehydrogenase [Calothrix sp. NIES-4101]|nr:aldehyde dehydrogenase [Calothrix sp. NIES-4101]
MLSQIFISDLPSKQRQYFRTGTTKNIDYRIAQLQTLKQVVIEHESAIIEALKADLNKPEFEAYASEFSFVIKEINYAIKNIKNWVKAKKASIPFILLPASAQIIPEPLGVALIIGPWNYPFQLILTPLIGAIASGNCAVIKPSEFAPHTSHLITEIISKNFPQEYISVVEGDVEISKQLLQEKFDHIFFTGSTATGKIIMAAAAKNLTPVTLELGGKSPCIVDKEINLEVTARRIAWGKFYNAGQSCIAPDYILINKDIKEEFLKNIEKCIQEFYGDNPKNSPDYARIINQRQFSRAANLLQGDIRIGGEINADELYISPTVIDNVTWEDTIMQDEIFAPILSIVEYIDINEVIDKINLLPKPLALYIFSNNKKFQQKILSETSSGGVCINDVLKQWFTSTLAFGGVGDSGIGSYHGKASFDTFSHYKSVVNRKFFLDASILYAPYAGKLSLLKKLLRW